MNSALLAQYSMLVEFLGNALGPDFEVILHDISSKKHSVAAIANGHISGRNVDAPLTDLALQFIYDKTYQDCDYKCNYSGISKGNKMLRASTFFIKDPSGKLVGMLCINFDPSRYEHIAKEVMQLCQMDQLQNLLPGGSDVSSPLAGGIENFSESIPEVTATVLQNYLASAHIPPERLTQEEKLDIVNKLNQRGIFLLKGAVSEVAAQLHCSEASIYRYLSKLNKKA